MSDQYRSRKLYLVLFAQCEVFKVVRYRPLFVVRQIYSCTFLKLFTGFQTCFTGIISRWFPTKIIQTILVCNMRMSRGHI